MAPRAEEEGDNELTIKIIGGLPDYTCDLIRLG